MRRKTATARSSRSTRARATTRASPFDDAGKQLAFLSDQAEYDKKVSPYRLYYWKAGDAAADRARVGGDARHAAGHGRERQLRAALLARTARGCISARRRRRRRRATGRTRPRRSRVDLWSYKDPLIQPMQQVRATGAQRATTARSCTSPTSASCSWRRRSADRERRRRSGARASARPTCRTGRRSRGTRPTTTSISST